MTCRTKCISDSYMCGETRMHAPIGMRVQGNNKLGKTRERIPATPVESITVNNDHD